MQASQPPAHPARVTPLCLGLVAAIATSLGWPLPAAHAQTVARHDARAPTVYYGNQKYPSEHHFYGRASEAEELERIERELVELEASEAIRQARRDALARRGGPRTRGVRRSHSRSHARAQRTRARRSGAYAYGAARSGYEVVSYPAKSCGPYGCSNGVTYRPSYGLYSLYAPYICGAEGGYGFDGRGFNYGYEFGESSTFYDRAYWCVYRGGGRRGQGRGSQAVQTREHQHDQRTSPAQYGTSVGLGGNFTHPGSGGGKTGGGKGPGEPRPGPRGGIVAVPRR